MKQEGFRRKLAAILSADVAGYSSLMQTDEDSTIRILTNYRSTISKLIQKFRGHVVDATGDNLMAKFSSVVDAVNCAVEIQNELAERNAEFPKERRMDFRIGINLGDIVEKEDRIYGDGVNIAARIESLADPGGICISGSAYEQIENKLALGYKYIGKHSAKNISKPITVYRVPIGPAGTTAKVKRKRSTRQNRYKPALIGLSLVVLVAIAFMAWNYYLLPPLTSKKIDSKSIATVGMPEKLSIAVLPFTNMGGDPNQEYFSDGITEEIITQLARFSDIHVIARNSSFTYKGKPVKVQQVGQELGVRYVLEGSVLKSGDKIRVTAQLVDAATGGHVWAERYDRKNEDIFALHDDISQHIAAALGSSTGALEIAERKRVMSSNPNNLSAFETFLRATEHFHRFTKDDNLKARNLGLKATELKPDYAQAYGGVGWTHFTDYLLRWTETPESSLNQAYNWAQKALAIDPTDYESYWLLSIIYPFRKEYDKSLASAQRALSLNPNSASLLQSLGGNVYTYLGGANEAVQMIEKAMRLDPRHPVSWYDRLGRACYAARQYEKAVKALKHIGQPKIRQLLYLAASYGRLGLKEKANAEVAQILKLDPKVTVETWAEREPYKNSGDKEHWIDGLRKAGIPMK